MYIGGLDIGTTGCKLTVFDETGKYLGREYQNYPLHRGSSESTLNAETLLESVYSVIRKTASRYPDLAGFGVTSFGETFVLTDEAGTPLAPSMLYTDPRGKEQRTFLEQALGSRRIAELTGARPHETYSIPKLMWVRDNHPDVFAETRHVFLMEDFVVWSLTHTAQIDYSLAARTMAFDIHKLNWSQPIFDAAGIDPSLFSRPVPSGTAAGTITRETAQKTGLSEGTIVVSVSHDQVAACIGAGGFSSDSVVDGSGTVECLNPILDAIPDMDHMYDGNYAVVPYVIPGKYVCYAYETTGGALMQWCTETLTKREKELAEDQNSSVHSYMEQKYLQERGRNEPSGLLVLPHFAGAATPYMDTGSKGAILGLTVSSTAADIYWGCLEGIIFEMMINVEKMQKAGVSFKEVRATGGGAHSQVWMQMKADMLNIPVTAMQTLDAGTVGSAMLTGIALGCFENLDDAAAQMVVTRKTYTPNPDLHEAYQKLYQRYRGVYDAVRPLMT